MSSYINLILQKGIVSCTNAVKTQFTVIKAPLLSCAIMMMIIMIKYYAYFQVFCYFKIANRARDNCMFRVVHSDIQKFTIIMIMKPIIFISIWI